MIADTGFFALGLLIGTLHFSLLRWNTALYARPGPIWLGAGLQLARMATLGGVLTLAALHGALPLLLVAIGVLVARPVVMAVMP